MKGKIIILVGAIIIVLIGGFVVANLRSVYFVDGSTGEVTKLTSVWFKQNEIEIKDRWFSDFDEDIYSGVIYIEDKREYTIIPYSFTVLDDDGDLGDLYSSELNRVKAVFWIEKNNDEPLVFEIDNEQKYLIAVGTYSGTSYDETQYGFGIYSIPLFKDNGELYYHLQFPTYSLAGINEGFNDGNPCYILQEVIYTEISVSNHNEETFFFPLEFVGGLSSDDVLDSDHYYLDYNGNQIIFEAFLKRVE